MGERIKPVRAKELNENWRGKNGNGPGPAVQAAGFKDSYETWFSMEELEKYLQYVKDNIPASENPGIRIYFGNYGVTGDQKNKLSTAFLAPTRQVESQTDGGTTTNENVYTLDAYNDGSQPWPPDPYLP